MIVVFALVFAPSAAFAQWGSLAPNREAITRRTVATRIVQFQSRDWGQCTGAEDVEARRAISACGRIIAQRVSRSHTAAAYFHRGWLRKNLGDTAGAQSDFERSIATFGGVITTDPTASNYLNRASVLYFVENYSAALDDFTHAVELNPDLAIAHARRADILFRLHNYAASATAFDQAARLEPEVIDHQIGRCMARAAADADIEIAAEACDAALRMSEGSTQALTARGFLRFKQARYEEALRDFTAASDAAGAPPNPLASYGQAVASARLNQDGAQARAERTLSESHWLAVYADAGLRP